MLEFLLKENKERKIVIVGSSLGGNVIANLLPMYDDGSIAAVALCNPSLDL